ncbi:type II toxin-antitoxin system RelE/ParE family toxin [Aquisalimonas sp. APHAB1-3]|uniref:type II toxin-antitoxin system RelE/ParE family toxin n=1 Tax=Aquisalimonas sp. APHAB1-3 TaxID=3402080 RepID=UPI003AAA3BD2
MAGTYRITRRAEADLYDIARYTEAEWGRDQRTRYLKALETRFGWLAGNPALGQAREDVAAGYYCYPHGRHLIFYMCTAQGIDIIGIPHQRMDPGSFP